MDSQLLTTIGFLCTITAVICAWIYYVFQIKPDDDDEGDGRESEGSGDGGHVLDHGQSGGSGSKGNKKKQGRNPQPLQTTNQFQFSSPWLVSTLKGHSGPVTKLSMSSNNHFLASAGEDRTILIWIAKNLEERDHKQFRVNIPFDCGSQIDWSPDNKAFLISKLEGKCIEVYKLAKKTDGNGYNITKSLEYPVVHKALIVGLGVAVNGRFVMSISEDGLMVIWNLKGGVLEEKWISTTGLTVSGKLSPCGRYVAGCGTFNDSIMEIFEVKVQPSGTYKPLELRFKLPGHKFGISAFDFSVDGNQVVTLGMDSVWRLFDTTGNRVTVGREAHIETMSTSESPVITLSHDARVILVGSNQTIYVYSGISGAPLAELYGAHQEPIKSIIFSANDKYFLTSGDRQIRVFRNIPGLEEKIFDLEALLNNQSTGQALKTRLREEIELLKVELNALLVSQQH